MSIDEQIAVMNAFKDGKTIQMRERNSIGDWFRKPSFKGGFHSFNFVQYDYRVKPEENSDLMTFEMLTEWLARGNGLRYSESDNDKCYIYNFACYIKSEKNRLVDKSCRVKRFGSDEELLPTKELYYKDCSPRKDDFEERFLECLKKYISENKS